MSNGKQMYEAVGYKVFLISAEKKEGIKKILKNY